MIKANDLMVVLSLFARFGVVHLIVEDGKFAITIDSDEPWALTTGEMSVIHQLGWRWNGWTEQWEQ
ncbi:MAG: hypothetical protein EOM24_04210 [Chloroflexia bacterium]|nr:hypothetical protein [Chloroflexia bacterium]